MVRKCSFNKEEGRLENSIVAFYKIEIKIFARLVIHLELKYLIE
jgi:hypothetical protein